jgi:hypothetical protein
MNLSKLKTSVTHPRGSRPAPWYVFYQFSRVICIGCVVTFGPRRADVAKEAQIDALQVRLVKALSILTTLGKAVTGTSPGLLSFFGIIRHWGKPY